MWIKLNMYLDFFLHRGDTSNKVKILGLYVYSKLKWSFHINELATNLSVPQIYPHIRLQNPPTSLTFTLWLITVFSFGACHQKLDAYSSLKNAETYYSSVVQIKKMTVNNSSLKNEYLSWLVYLYIYLLQSNICTYRRLNKIIA